MATRNPSDRPTKLGVGQASARQEAMLGSKYVTAALKRIAREKPHLLNKAAHRLFLDAAGDTTVEKAVVRPPVEGEEGMQVARYRVEMDPADRHRALALIRDTLQGKPQQEIRVEGAPATNVVVIHANVGEAPELPESVKRILEEKESGDLGEDEDGDDDEL